MGSLFREVAEVAYFVINGSFQNGHGLTIRLPLLR